MDNLLESDKLDNCVWNLSSPKWLETVKETCISFSISDLVESCHSVSRESSFSSGLHSYLSLKTQSKFHISFNKKLLTASHGQRRTSAMTSAHADETAKPTVLYFGSFSPAAFL